MRYDYRGKSTAHMDEAEKFGHRRLEQAEAERIRAGGDPDEKPGTKFDRKLLT